MRTQRRRYIRPATWHIATWWVGQIPPRPRVHPRPQQHHLFWPDGIAAAEGPTEGFSHAFVHPPRPDRDAGDLPIRVVTTIINAPIPQVQHCSAVQVKATLIRILQCEGFGSDYSASHVHRVTTPVCRAFRSRAAVTIVGLGFTASWCKRVTGVNGGPSEPLFAVGGHLALPTEARLLLVGQKRGHHGRCSII